MKQRSLRLLAACAAIALLSAADAAWSADLYLSGAMHTSSATGRAGGSTDFFEIDGSDSDSSTVWGGNLGMGFRLNELDPDGWGAEMPPWTVRFELEGLMGRDYEFLSDASGVSTFFNDVEAWTITTNSWLDLPVYPVISKLFGRVPVFEPLSIYAGGGFGLAHVELDTTDNVSSGSKGNNNFTWLAGAGIAYELTEAVTVTAGYRYQNLGEAEASLSLGPGFPFGSQTVEIESHEFVSTLRLDYHTAPLDEVMPTRWAWPRVSLPSWKLPEYRGPRPRWPSFRRPRWLGGGSSESEPRDTFVGG